MIRGNQATSFSGEPVSDKLSPARPRVCVSGGSRGVGAIWELSAGGQHWQAGGFPRQSPQSLLSVSAQVETFPVPDMGASVVGPH